MLCHLFLPGDRLGEQVSLPMGREKTTPQRVVEA